MKRLFIAAVVGVSAIGIACSSFTAADPTPPAIEAGVDAAVAAPDDAAAPASDACVDGATSIFVFGGYTYPDGSDQGPLSKQIYRAPVRCDGTLGTWNVERELDVPLAYPNVAVLSGKLLVFNGMNDTGPPAFTSRILVYDRSADGGLADPTPKATGIHHRWRASLVSVGNVAYVLGGEDETQARLALVESVQLSAAGEPLVSVDGNIPMPDSRFASGTIGGYLTLLGGNQTPASAPVLVDGGVGEWQRVPGSSEMQQDNASFSANGRLYFLGGTSTNRRNVTIVTGDARGLAFVMAAETPASLGDVDGIAAVPVGGRVYLIGGSLNERVVSASPGSDGLVDFRAESSLPLPLRQLAAVAF